MSRQGIENDVISVISYFPKNAILELYRYFADNLNTYIYNHKWNSDNLKNSSDQIEELSFFVEIQI